MTDKFITGDKIFYHPERLTNWINKEITNPITLELHPSNKCNNNCWYCLAEKQKDGFQMSEKQLMLVSEKIAEAGVKGLIYSGGGEPTLHPSLPQSMKYLHEKGVKLGLITNGALLKGELAQTVLDTCSWVRISFDTSNYETYHAIRGVYNLIEVVKNITQLVSIKKEIGSKCTIGTQAVVSKQNIDEIVATAEFVKNLGVDYFQIRPLESYKGDCNYTKEELDKIAEIKKIVLEKETDSFKVLFSKKWDVVEVGNTDRGFRACWCYPFIGAISAHGRIYICCHFVGDKNFEYGNLFEEDWDKILQRREEISKNIELDKCPMACRGSSPNRCLEGMIKGIQHQEFL